MASLLSQVFPCSVWRRPAPDNAQRAQLLSERAPTDECVAGVGSAKCRLIVQPFSIEECGLRSSGVAQSNSACYAIAAASVARTLRSPLSSGRQFGAVAFRKNPKARNPGAAARYAKHRRAVTIADAVQRGATATWTLRRAQAGGRKQIPAEYLKDAGQQAVTLHHSCVSRFFQCV